MEAIDLHYRFQSSCAVIDRNVCSSLGRWGAWPLNEKQVSAGRVERTAGNVAHDCRSILG